MLVCSCALPACLANGCQQAVWFNKAFKMPTIPSPLETTKLPAWKPVTEDDVRRIIREELQQFKKDAQ